MNLFRYERSASGVGVLRPAQPASGEQGRALADVLASESAPQGAGAQLRALVLAPLPPVLTLSEAELLRGSALPLIAVLNAQPDARTLALGMHCVRLVPVADSGIRLSLSNGQLPFVGDAQGISISEAHVCGLVDTPAPDLATAIEAAIAWASAYIAGADLTSPSESVQSTVRRWAELPAPPADGLDAATVLLGARASRIGLGVQHARDSLNTSLAGRLFGSYLIEGLTLLGDGVAAESIEEAAVQAGFALGPLAALDEAGLGPLDAAVHAAMDGHGHGHGHEHEHEHHHSHGHAHCHHGHEHGHHEHHDDTAHSCGHAHPEPTLPPLALSKSAIYVVEKMSHGFKRFGRTAGAGFYSYDEDGRADLWSGLSSFKRRAAAVSAEDIQERLLMAMALEARRCLSAGLIDSVRSADIVSLYGCGFPLASGGVATLTLKDGPSGFERRCAALAARYGAQFAPADEAPHDHDHDHAHHHDHHDHGKH